MYNLICRILVIPVYESLIIYSDAVIEPLPCYLHPIILHHMVPMLMDAMVILLKMQRQMSIHSSPHAILFKINNIKYTLSIINIKRILC